MSYLALILVFLSSAWANLETIQIKNLDLQYTYPYGSGELEVLKLGITKNPVRYPVEIFRRENSIEITSPFVTFEWLKPDMFVHYMQELQVKSFNLLLAEKENHAKGESFLYTSAQNKTFILNNFDLSCEGSSSFRDPIDRLKVDCLEKMKAKVRKMELPIEIVKSLFLELPTEEDAQMEEMPADDFSLTVDKGDFSGYVKIKYILRAYLKFAGHIQHEDAGKTTAIRIDSIKFGKLSVTNTVLKILKKEIQSPNVIVDPPWIRIKE